MNAIGAYFSPSGGTKRACELVGGLFDAKEYVNLGGRTRAQRNFSKDELLVLAVPVYAGQMPAVPGLLDGLKGENTPCVILATYGNRHYDETLAQVSASWGSRASGAPELRRSSPPTFLPLPWGRVARTRRTPPFWSSLSRV